MTNPEKLIISTHERWVTVHPANLVVAAALAIRAGKENTEIVGTVPETGRYLDRMGLYDLTRTPSPFIYHKKEESGRFVPIKIIKTAENAGAGLFFIKSIAKITRNYFVIYSGGAEYTLLKYRKRIKGLPKLYADPEKDRHSAKDTLPNFQGTLVAVDLSLHETPEFNYLLSNIGDVYDKAIRDRKRAKYKTPKFI
ncbi:hypothetical protein HGA88_02705 [Candidatus Roizmanbacteria bacterium]|nr:hypothetical protein [Candidatus Roizmanbacteria bacterium]